MASKHCKKKIKIKPGSIRYSHKAFVGAEIVNCFAVISYWHWSAAVGEDVVDSVEGVDNVVFIEAVVIEPVKGVDDNDDMVEGADVDLVEEPIAGLDVVDKGNHASPLQLQQGSE